jgi:hypothetical protein
MPHAFMYLKLFSTHPKTPGDQQTVATVHHKKMKTYLNNHQLKLVG